MEFEFEIPEADQIILEVLNRNIGVLQRIFTLEK